MISFLYFNESEMEKIAIIMSLYFVTELIDILRCIDVTLAVRNCIFIELSQYCINVKLC